MPALVNYSGKFLCFCEVMIRFLWVRSNGVSSSWSSFNGLVSSCNLYIQFISIYMSSCLNLLLPCWLKNA